MALQVQQVLQEMVFLPVALHLMVQTVQVAHQVAQVVAAPPTAVPALMAPAPTPAAVEEALLIQVRTAAMADNRQEVVAVQVAEQEQEEQAEMGRYY
jgi:hypothetical protein